MGKEITQIRVGQRQVGLIGLHDVLTQVRSLSLESPDAIQTEIIKRLRSSNYISPQVEAEYGHAVLREYRRFCGEVIEEETGVLEIRVLGQGCMRCDELMSRVMTAVAELKVPADVQHIRDLTRIAEYGMVATPALVVNGKLVTMGKVPTVKELKEMLR